MSAQQSTASTSKTVEASSAAPVSAKPASATVAAAPAQASTTASVPAKAKALEEKAPETADDKISRAKAANDRFKRRGKRTAAAVADSDKQDNAAGTASKKAKSSDAQSDKPKDEDDAYTREVKQYMSRSLKDEGAGKRPLVR